MGPTMRSWIAPVLLLALPLVGCGSKKPVLYPNRQLERAGQEVAQLDIDECLALAEAYAGSSEAKEAAASTAEGATVGAATGAAAGAVLGSAGRGAGAGAAGGAARSFTRWLFDKSEPQPLVRSYTERCLRERGYEPLGWK
ncbi:MAG: glycine zipper family protein [Myxococcota bacterium]